MTWKVEEYIAEDGSSPYRDWFDGLQVQAAAKVTTAMLRMEMGNTSSVKWFDGIGEYRIDLGARLSYLSGARWRQTDSAIYRRHQGQPEKRHQAGDWTERRGSGAKRSNEQSEVMTCR